MNKEAMAEMSTYIQYLPAMLWSAQDDPDRLLGRMLRIFEKILTGIDDDIAYEQQPLERTIDQLPLLFDAWQTKPALLDWLAAWLDLSLRTDWSEYRKRSMIARIMQIYARSGFKASLADHLFLYAGSRFSPRIAVDGGEALWRVTVKPDGSAHLYPVAFSGLGADVRVPKPDKPTEYENKKEAILLHPTAVALDNHKECYIVADQGSPLTDSKVWGPTIWRISPIGEFVDWGAYGNGMPKPQPIYSPTVGSTVKLIRPMAIAVDLDMDEYFVLDDTTGQGAATLYRIDLCHFAIEEKMKFDVKAPVDMIFDRAGRLIILDSKEPSLTVLKRNGTKEWTKLGQYLLNKPGDSLVIEKPTALAILDDNSYLIADARTQELGEEDDPIPPYSSDILDKLVGDLIKVRVQYSDGNTPTMIEKESMLRGKGILAKENPLIYPSGLDVAPASSDLLEREVYVCDVGVKTGSCDDETLRLMAEPASIFRIKLSDNKPEITPIAMGNALVCPTKLKIDRAGRLLVTDQGAYYTGRHLGGQQHDWRADPYELGVMVHFSNQHFARIGADNEGNREDIGTLHKLVIHDLQEMVETEKPAHSKVWCDLNHPLLKV